MNLRNLSRQHDSLTRNYVQLKLQFQTILDQVFPEYKGVFGNLYSPVSLKTLRIYPTSDCVLKAPTDEIASMMHSLGGKRSYAWFWGKANKLKEAAERNPFKNTLYMSHLITLKMYIQMLLQQKEFLSILEQEIDELATEFEEYEILRSIPGVGCNIAATLISEIGDIKHFSHPKKLVALQEWILITKGKTFDEYFNEYPSGIFENVLFEISILFIVIPLSLNHKVQKILTN